MRLWTFRACGLIQVEAVPDFRTFTLSNKRAVLPSDGTKAWLNMRPERTAIYKSGGQTHQANGSRPRAKGFP